MDLVLLPRHALPNLSAIDRWHSVPERRNNAETCRMIEVVGCGPNAPIRCIATRGLPTRHPRAAECNLPMVAKHKAVV